MTLLAGPNTQIADDFILDLGGQGAEFRRFDIDIRGLHVVDELFELLFGRETRVGLFVCRDGGHGRFGEAVRVVLSELFAPFFRRVEGFVVDGRDNVRGGPTSWSGTRTGWSGVGILQVVQICSVRSDLVPFVIIVPGGRLGHCGSLSSCSLFPLAIAYQLCVPVIYVMCSYARLSSLDGLPAHLRSKQLLGRPSVVDNCSLPLPLSLGLHVSASAFDRHADYIDDISPGRRTIVARFRTGAPPSNTKTGLIP